MSSNAPHASRSSLEVRPRSLALIAVTASACATAPLPITRKTSDPGRAAFDAWVVAARLFQRGVHDADGDALATAARLMERYPPRVDLTYETEPGQIVAPSRTPRLSPDEAHRLAEMHGHAPFSPAAALGQGPRLLHHQLGPEGRDFVSLEHAPGMAELTVVSDAGADLDLWVLDASGATVCFDVEVGDPSCRWFVATSSRFEITLKNSGHASTRYVLVVR